MQFIIVAICHELFTLYHLRNLSLCSVPKIRFDALCHFLFSFPFSWKCILPGILSLDSACVEHAKMVRGAGTKSDREHTYTPHAQCTCAFTQMFIIYNQRIPFFPRKKCPSDNGNNTTINILNLLRPHSTELMAVSFMLSLYFIYIYWSGCGVVVAFILVALHYRRCPAWTLSIHI